MCNFLSAIVMKNGRILCNPEHTDSHSDLIAANDLRDDDVYIRGWVRVEFTSKTPANPETYALTVDETSVPDWFDKAKQFDAAEELRKKVVAMILPMGKRAMLLGGCYILCDGVEVESVRSARIVSMYGSSNVGSMYGSSNVGSMSGSSNVGYMYGSSKVGYMYDSSNVGSMYDSSNVGYMSGSSNVGSMYDSSNVGSMSGSSNVGSMSGSSNVGSMSGSSKVAEDKRIQQPEPAKNIKKSKRKTAKKTVVKAKTRASKSPGPISGRENG